MTGVAVQALGCRVNRADLDSTAAEVVAAGIPLVDADEAAVIVINTCAVTAEAEAKCRQAVRRACAREQKPWVVVTGCAARLFAAELEALDEHVIVLKDRSLVAPKVIELIGTDTATASTDISYLTPTGRSRPLIKIQDGCDLRCTYCIVWKARGASRSHDPEKVIDEVNAAVARGAGEVVLTGINIGCYDAETSNGHLRLPGLLNLLLNNTDVGRIRISSIEPQDVDEELVDVMASSDGRVAPFLHMCLQSGSNAVLKRMGRIYTAEEFEARVRLAHTYIPKIAISTDIIAGFPGETENDFEDTFRLAEDCAFSWLHVFRYSQRPGTPAASMPQVESHIKADRSERLRELALRLRAEEAARCVGRVERVTAQGAHLGVSGGLLDVELQGEAREGELVNALVTSARDDGTLVARII